MSSYTSWPSSSSSGNDHSEDLIFEVFDYLTFNEDFLEGFTTVPPVFEQQQLLQEEDAEYGGSAGGSRSGSCGGDNGKRGCKRMREEIAKPAGLKVAFRTKSEQEILDDGYKWRRYGRKMVKGSPNPRNYYWCSTEGCNIKKRVERDRDDSNYVITTYEGVHNHHAPTLVASNHVLEPIYAYGFSSDETHL